MTLRHQVHIGSLSLSPDNSLLAVGGQNSDIYVWSLKDQKLIRAFSNPLEGQEITEEACNKAIFDINWSHDGASLAAGFESNVVLLNMRRILSVPVEALQEPTSNKQLGSQPSRSVKERT